MKHVFAILILLVSNRVFAAAGAESCDSHDPSESVCELTWKQDGIERKLQLYSKVNGCEFPEGMKRDCARLRLCEADKVTETGASVLLDQTSAGAYCARPMDLFASGSAPGPTAFVDCDPKKKVPSQVRLVSPDKSQTKVCPYPVQGSRK